MALSCPKRAKVASPPKAISTALVIWTVDTDDDFDTFIFDSQNARIKIKDVAVVEVVEGGNGSSSVAPHDVRAEMVTVVDEPNEDIDDLWAEEANQSSSD
eukprot:3357843-Amphidinium_carterae.1